MSIHGQGVVGVQVVEVVVLEAMPGEAEVLREEGRQGLIVEGHQHA